MKHLFTSRNFVPLFLCFFCFSCETEQQVEQNDIILQDPLYIEYDQVYQSLSASVTKEKVLGIQHTINNCDINHNDVCTILENECVQKNQEAITYYSYHCRMTSLRESIKEKYRLSKNDFMELHIQDIKSRMVYNISE